MDTDWQEINRISFPAETLQNGLAPAATAGMVAYAVFDSTQDLLWTGNQLGRITSFYGSELQRYTSYRGHAQEEGIVRHIVTCDKGIISLSSRSIHMASRKGLAMWHITRPDFQDLRCLSFTSSNASELVVAGCQQSMFRIDVDRGQVNDTLTATSNYTMMKRGGSYICAATVDGWVQLLDSQTIGVQKSWHAHGAFVTDMDVNANFLVTCGCSTRQQLGALPDPLVKVFDLKTLLPLPPVSFPGGAAYVRLHPRMQTTCMIAGQNGQIQINDTMSPIAVNIKQVNLINAYLTSLDLAPSGEAMILNDSNGFMQLWGSPSRTRFNDLPAPTEFPDSTSTVSTQMDWNGEEPFGTIGMPYYKDVLFSAWPSHLIFEVGYPAAKLDPDIVTSLTRTEIGAYGPNPRRTKRNQSHNAHVEEEPPVEIEGPKFLSEKAKQAGAEGGDGRRISDVLETLSSLSVNGTAKDSVPVIYRPFEIKYSKFGVEDFDFEYYNKTPYSGLETHISNSYINPLLQLFRFTPVLRNLALLHTASTCLFETCLLCELGFLIDMLEKAKGVNCQATNFLRTFSSLPDAGSLGLLEDAYAARSLSMPIQNANRFILQKAITDFRTHAQQSNPMETALRTGVISTLRCSHCHSDTVKLTPQLVHELTYPGRTPQKHPRVHGPTFSQILKSSVERQESTRGWCDRCKRYQQLVSRRTVQAIPPVLTLNTAIRSPEARTMWSKRGWLPKEIGIIVDNGQFFCYEGQDLRLHIARGIFPIKVYELVGLVAEVQHGGSQKSHLVSLINVSTSSRTRTEQRQWHLFNDFLVRNITEDDALKFDAQWKLPQIVTYQCKDYRHSIDDSWRETMDTSLLYRKWSVQQDNDPLAFRPLNHITERPVAGTPVGIDAEFVKLQAEELELRADGTKHVLRPANFALARVSVLRGSPSMKSQDGDFVPFIDDYVHVSEPIIDYLTEFSGISVGDLDPSTSPYASTGRLVSRKIAYKKIWLLLNLGCIFVGHGLAKDFRTINIHVPKSQTIDTVHLFFDAKHMRYLSLKFLSWLLLKEVIQSEESNDGVQPPKGHDSVIDAKMALRLWEKWTELERDGTADRVIEDIYRRGRAMNFQVPKRTVNRSSGSAVSSETPFDAGTPTTSLPGTPRRNAAILRAP